MFGATKKWARAFSGLDGEPPDTDWYGRRACSTIVLVAGALDSFTVATAGTLTSVPASTSSGASGFCGGGFSGGGFGGGGGGSW